jgi:hypothetical protein
MVFREVLRRKSTKSSVQNWPDFGATFLVGRSDPVPVPVALRYEFRARILPSVAMYVVIEPLMAFETLS